MSEGTRWYDVIARHVGTEADFGAAGVAAVAGAAADAFLFPGGVGTSMVAALSAIGGLAVKKGIGAIFGPPIRRRREHRRLRARLASMLDELETRIGPVPAGAATGTELIKFNPLRSIQLRVETAGRMWRAGGIDAVTLTKILDEAQDEILQFGIEELVQELPVWEIDAPRLLDD